MDSIVFTDRYQAAGIPYPDAATVCQGQCEGMGCIPVRGDETDTRLLALWQAVHAKPHVEECDGWHFVTCPDCSGTGKRSLA